MTTKKPDLTFDQASKLALKSRWKVVECETSGCWCRVILPEKDILYREEITPNTLCGDTYDSVVICSMGAVSKEFAEKIVEDHNKNI